VTLGWQAPGDDWLCGQADRYQVIASRHRIRHPDDGTVIAEDAAGPAGAAVERTLSAAEVGDARYAAVLYRDEAGNWGLLRTVRLPAIARSCGNTIQGTPLADHLVGTPGSDQIRAHGGDDTIEAREGDDCVRAGFGDDDVQADRGADRVAARGRGLDVVDCGAGDDVARVGRRDQVHRCETVLRP
jgi:Ca2+-binding RTX toxin-like protein